MRSVVFWAQSDPGHPLINKSSILPSADMVGMINSARKDELVKRTTSTFEPSLYADATGLKEFELNRPAGLLLNHDRARSNPAAADKVADFGFHDVTPAQLTIYSQIEHCAVTQPVFAVEPKPDSPNLLGFQRAFRALHPARIPRAPIFSNWIVF